MGSTARLFLYVQELRTSDSRNCTEYRADNPQKSERTADRDQIFHAGLVAIAFDVRDAALRHAERFAELRLWQSCLRQFSD